jgi:hypothetical protein
MTAGGVDPSTTPLTVFAKPLRRGDHLPPGVAAAHETALTPLQLPLEFVHHRVESGHGIARHGAGSDDVSAATPDQRDLAYLALVDAPVRLLDEADLGALDGIEIAVEVTNLFVDSCP